MSQYYLDDIDKKILNILKEDARTPFSKIAKMLNLSEATIHMRIKRLINYGIIKGFYVDIDPEKLGLSVVAFVLIKADPKRYREVAEKLSEMKEVYEVHEVTGEYTVLIKVRVSNREDLAKVLDMIGNIDGVNGTYTMFVLRSHKENKSPEL